jgi:hypothetical protein
MTAPNGCQGHLNPQPTIPALTSSPKWVQYELGYPTDVGIPLAQVNQGKESSLNHSSSHSSSKQAQVTQINELHKSPVTRTLANEPKDHCKHQQMLDQAKPAPAQGMVIHSHQDKHQIGKGRE